MKTQNDNIKYINGHNIKVSYWLNYLSYEIESERFQSDYVISNFELRQKVVGSQFNLSYWIQNKLSKPTIHV